VCVCVCVCVCVIDEMCIIQYVSFLFPPGLLLSHPISHTHTQKHIRENSGSSLAISFATNSVPAGVTVTSIRFKLYQGNPRPINRSSTSFTCVCVCVCVCMYKCLKLHGELSLSKHTHTFHTQTYLPTILMVPQMIILPPPRTRIRLNQPNPRKHTHTHTHTDTHTHTPAHYTDDAANDNTSSTTDSHST
jgi:hypothetical protein